MTPPLFVGIAGGSASGKTTLCEALCEALQGLRIQTFHMDTYFLPVKPPAQAPFTGTIWDDYNHPTSFDLEGLRKDMDALAAAKEPPDVAIVEGLLTLQDDAIRAKLDLRIFVDAPADERIVRRLWRNMAKGLAFDEIAAYYLESVRWRHQEYVEPSRWHADIVYNGMHPSSTALDVLVAWIRNRVSMDRAGNPSAEQDSRSEP